MTWEEQFKKWAGPPGVTEQSKCENAERVCRKAIAASSILASRRVTVIPQGSYRNRTNCGAVSDVDICALYTDNTFFFDLPAGMTIQNFGIRIPADYPYAQYKNEVEQALVSYLGRSGVTRGDKAFDVHENTYRIDADVVPCFEYRRYDTSGRYIPGTAFLADSGKRIINYPEQNYRNGVKKNDDTGRRFKAVVRILKSLRAAMEADNIPAAKPIPSYLVECLVWNVPNVGFGHDTYTADVRYALAHLFNNTRRDDDCKEWGEVNELKYLFRPTQPWTKDQAHAFVSAAWDYVGFR